MSVKTFNTRVKNKIDRASVLTTNHFVPLLGEIVIGGSGTSSLSNNSIDSPYVAKIGDGTTEWQNLPSVAYIPLKGEAGTISGSNGNYSIPITVPTAERVYVYEEVNSNNNVEQLTIDLTATNPYLGEHYVLIKNVGNSDIWFNGITANFGNNVTVNINTRQDYIVAGDICEVQIKVFKISGTYYITAIPQLGINQSVTSSNGENTWNVNRFIIAN